MIILKQIIITIILIIIYNIKYIITYKGALCAMPGRPPGPRKGRS